MPRVGENYSNVTLLNRTGVSESDYDGTEQVRANLYQKWQFELTTSLLAKTEHIGAWMSFLTSLRGRLGTFYAPLPLRLPRYAMTTVQLAAPASARARTIQTSGWNQVSAASYPAGTLYFSQGGHLHLIVSTVDAPGGVATIDIEPALRVAMPAGTVLEFANPVGIFRATDDNVARAIEEVHRYQSFSLSAVEALR
jgi:hypothetical protein